MSRGMARAERLREMERLYLQRGFTDIEMAERLDVHRTTVFKDRTLMLEREFPFKQDADGRWRIDRTRYVSNVRVNLHEALALYLAARRTSRQTRTNQPHVAEAVSKLASALKQPMTGRLVAAADRILARQGEPERVKVLETVAVAWVEGVKVRLVYRALHRQGTLDHVVHPYLIEPSLWSDAIYLIGYSERMNAVVPFRVERIERASRMLESFPPPADFNEETLLQHAWGVWTTGREPEIVVLRFAPGRASRRLLESVWHPLEEVEGTPETGCTWRAPVAEWREMLPWIRGWGADVEVLAPPALRHSIRRHVERLSQLYGLVADGKERAIAHTVNDQGRRHDLVAHLETVAALAADFAAPLQAAELGHYLGLWHDLGKFHPDFQQYLLDAEAGIRRRGPDHKAAGVSLALEHPQLSLLALLLQGHHGGLKNRTDLKPWFNERGEKVERALEEARSILDLTLPEPPAVPAFARQNPHSAEFFLRMLFSALVDADFLDTEAHFSPEKSTRRGSEASVGTLYRRFEDEHRRRFSSAPDTPVNNVRQEIYDACLEAATAAPGLFRLSVPTGGGKTHSGMAFALRHAQAHGLQRIVVAVPYITITQQTANVYRAIFDQEGALPAVLEHHSGAGEHPEEVDAFTLEATWQRLAAENWDAPIIVTTTVQLFESLFARSTSRCRKLHRLAQSVIILDEAQSLPPHLLEPALDALRELCSHYGSTVVLSTATQPAFDELPPFKALDAHEIVPAPERHFRALKRVEYEWRLDPVLSWEEIAELMREEPQALAICNTKQDSLDLLDALADPNALHLSTLLCGRHRTEVIAEVLRRLQGNEPCRLIATQVVEAGVDIDFPLVLRALGPLDSIVQAAGRANREGKLPTGRVIVFQPRAGGLPHGSYGRATTMTQTMLNTLGEMDMHDPATLHQYFKKWYPLEDTDKEDVQKWRKRLDYPEVDARFRMIDQDTVSVVVTGYGAEEERRQVRGWLDRLRHGALPTRERMRQLQPYTVSLYKYNAVKYLNQGFLSPQAEEGLAPGLWEWTGDYDPVRGLATTGIAADRLVF